MRLFLFPLLFVAIVAGLFGEAFVSERFPTKTVQVASSGHATAPVYVTETHDDNGNFTPNVTTVSYGAGKTIVVFVCSALNTTVSTMTDSGGSTFVRQNGVACPSSSNRQIEVWTCLSSLTSTTLTINFSGSSNFDIDILQYTGVSAIGNNNTGTNASSSSISLAGTMQDANNRWVVGGCQVTSQAATATAGTVRLNNFQNNQATFALTTADNTQAGTGSLTTSWSLAGASEWAAVGVELRSLP